MEHLRENGDGDVRTMRDSTQPQVNQKISSHDITGSLKPEDDNSSNASLLASHEDSIGKHLSLIDDGRSIRSGDDSDGGEILSDKLSTSIFSNVEVDSYGWLPPEPADKGDDVEKEVFSDSVTNIDEDDSYDDNGTKWGQPSFSISGEEHQARAELKEERERAMLEAMNGQFKILASRFLVSENMPSSDEKEAESWLDTVVALSWEAALQISPDASQGKDMDPGSYVKIKCIACGKRQESRVIKGLVFKKNMAHKHMPTKYQNPRLLLLKGVLGHSGIGLSSLNSMEQEKGHLEKAINKMIEVCNPNVILVEKTVSRDIQEILEKAKITLVLDMKLNRLERISRCIGSPILSFTEVLSNPKLKQCESFHIERIMEDHKKPPSSKTLMFLEGFPRPLGCTILLQGANSDELKKVKRVLQYTVYAAYHLILETSFFEDQRIFLNSRHCGEEFITDMAEDRTATDCLASEKVEKDDGPASAELKSSIMDELPKLESPTNATTASLLEESEDATKILINGDSQYNPHPQIHSEHFYSSFRRFLAGHGPYFPVFGLHNSYLPVTHEAPDRLEEESPDGPALGKDEEMPVANGNADQIDDRDKYETHIDDRDKEEFSEVGDETKLSRTIAGEKVELSLVNLEDSSNNSPAKEKSQHEDDINGVLDAQSILILMSSRCITKQTVCVPSHLSRIKYYGNFDVSLGRYLQDIFHSQNLSCCGEPPEAHEYSYTHRNGSLTVRIKQLPLEHKLSGEAEGRIWMWTWCRKCKVESGTAALTPRVVISVAARNLSFGKFLELSFASHSSAKKLSRCGHLLHRDCLRFFGLGSKVALFRYSPVEIYTTCKPPPVLEFYNKNNQEMCKQEVLARGNKLFTEIGGILAQLKNENPDSLLAKPFCFGPVKDLTEVEKILMQEKHVFEDSLTKTDDENINFGTSAHYILNLNWLYQELFLQLFVWDHRIHQLLQEETTEQKNNILSGTLSVGNIKNSVEHSDSIESISSSDSQQYDGSRVVDYETNSVGMSRENYSWEGSGDVSENNCRMTNDSTTSSVDYSPVVHAVSPDSTNDYVDDGTTSASVSDGQGKSAEAVENENFPVSANDQLHDAHEFGLIKSSGPNNWIWTTFADSFVEYKNNISDGLFQIFDLVNRYLPHHLTPLQVISGKEEGMQFTLGPNGSVLTICEDEISSIISRVLAISEDQRLWADSLTGNEPGDGKGERIKSFEKSHSMTSEFSRLSSGSSDSEASFSRALSADEIYSAYDSTILLASQDLHPEIYVNGKVSLKDKYSVICIYAKQFHDLRKKCCPSELSYIASLSHCMKWNAKGGKSKGFFAKTMDDRLIIKQIKRTELESFLTFGPDYFKHVSYSLDTGSQTCLAKILGIYQVRQIKNGKELKTDLMVMENLLFGHNISRTYDLKGAVFSRHVNDSHASDTVYLDQNFIEDMRVSPIYLTGKTKQLLQRAIWNDTSFLTSINVMDYSLLVGVDRQHHALVFGIIDYLRQYTWDKQLETWVKSSLVVPKNVSPTVVSPKEYKKRFRRFMSRYILIVPDTWNMEHSSLEQALSHGNNGQSKDVDEKPSEHSIEVHA